MTERTFLSRARLKDTNGQRKMIAADVNDIHAPTPHANVINYDGKVHGIICVICPWMDCWNVRAVCGLFGSRRR